MQFEVLNINGEQTGRSVVLPDEIFAAPVCGHVVYLAVKQYLAAQRQGTHKAKNRKEVHGSSRKLHRQKGTGGSRKGNIRNPLYRGGGTVFGPQPRDYRFKLNRKEKDLARVSVFSQKVRDSAFFIVEKVQMDIPKTKTICELLKNLKLSDKKVMYLLAEGEGGAVYLSCRNLPNVKSVLYSHANIYDLVNADVLLFSESAARAFECTQ